MNNMQKLILFFLGILMTWVAVNYGLSVIAPKEIEIAPQVSERVVVEESVSEVKENEKVYVNVFFIGMNENREEVYKAVKREYDEDIDGTKLYFAIHSLITGPKQNEQDRGVYTEIPPSTEILNIQEFPDKVIINLSRAFETGGGTDSLYKRLYQLIKTAKLNSTVPVYLYIEGKRADVIGGEGIMLSQPLSDRSLDG